MAHGHGYRVYPKAVSGEALAAALRSLSEPELSGATAGLAQGLRRTRDRGGPHRQLPSGHRAFGASQAGRAADR